MVSTEDCMMSGLMQQQQLQQPPADLQQQQQLRPSVLQHTNDREFPWTFRSKTRPCDSHFELCHNIWPIAWNLPPVKVKFQKKFFYFFRPTSPSRIATSSSESSSPHHSINCQSSGILFCLKIAYYILSLFSTSVLSRYHQHSLTPPLEYVIPGPRPPPSVCDRPTIYRNQLGIGRLRLWWPLPLVFLPASLNVDSIESLPTALVHGPVLPRVWDGMTCNKYNFHIGSPLLTHNRYKGVEDALDQR